MKIRVVLADDHRVLLAALCALLARTDDIEVVGEASSGTELLAVADREKPDVVVVDIGMPGMNGIEAARRLAAVQPGVRMLALSAFVDRRFVEGMLAAGAKGYLVKSGAGDDLARAIRAVARGETFLCEEAAAILVDAIRDGAGRQPAGVDALSRREREVLALIASGLGTSAIATQLGIAAATVEVHRRNIMRKLDLHNAVALTRFAIREGLAEP